jgi:hypothetical protein
MTLFELLTGVCLGVVAGVALAALGRWRSIGFSDVVSLGALGGAVGALIGTASSASGPVWGAMDYHPMAALFAFFGGGSAVALVRLLIGRSSRGRQRAPAIHRGWRLRRR